jgi:PAS domain S-box-containing protein
VTKDTEYPHDPMNDISKQKALEKALAESEERFRLITEFTRDWEYWINPEMEFVYISPSCETITGYKAEEFRNDSELLTKIIHPDDREAWQKPESIILQTDRPGSLDVCILTRSGESRWIHHLCQPVYNADGKWMGRQVSNRDITERKIAEKERGTFIGRLDDSRELQRVLLTSLMQAEEKERRVIARELHDKIGQSLTALKINLQTVEGVKGKGLDLSESIAMVEHMIQELRIISRNLPPTMLEDIGLAPALRWLVDWHGREASVTTSFITNLEETRLPPTIEIACFRVAQEGLTNVMRHAHAHQVKVELALVDQTLHLTIQDDGIGFDVDQAYERAPHGNSMGC